MIKKNRRGVSLIELLIVIVVISIIITVVVLGKLHNKRNRINNRDIAVSKMDSATIVRLDSLYRAQRDRVDSIHRAEILKHRHY